MAEATQRELQYKQLLKEGEKIFGGCKLLKPAIRGGRSQRGYVPNTHRVT